MKAFNKKIVKDMNSFATDFEAAQAANAQQPQGKKPSPERQVRMMAGPADMLGMDGLMMHEVDESRCTTLQFLNRGEVAKKPGTRVLSCVTSFGLWHDATTPCVICVPLA